MKIRISVARERGKIRGASCAVAPDLVVVETVLLGPGLEVEPVLEYCAFMISAACSAKP